MLSGQASEQNRQRHDGDNRLEQWFPVEPGNGRSQRHEKQRQREVDTRIDPPQRADLFVIDVFPLNDGLDKTIETEVLQQKAEGEHHGHQAKVVRCEQSCKNYRADCGERKPARLSEHRDTHACERSTA